MTKIKDVITDKQLSKLNDQDRVYVLENYESYIQRKPFKITYHKKEIFYGDIKDIVTDKQCDLSFLEGSVIKKVGFHKKASEGGLAIVYEKNRQDNIVVLGFTELGMWIYANFQKSKN